MSHWQDPNTGHSPPPKVVYLVVRQSSETVRVTLFTDESRSSSTFGVVTTGDEVSLEYMYLNRPGNAIEHRSRRHSGSTSLDIVGRPATRLIGHYWTDRDTRGELDFVERSTRQAESFDSARSLFG